MKFHSIYTEISLQIYWNFTPDVLKFHSTYTEISLQTYWNFTPDILKFHSRRTEISLQTCWNCIPDLLKFHSRRTEIGFGRRGFGPPPFGRVLGPCWGIFSQFRRIFWLSWFILVCLMNFLWFGLDFSRFGEGFGRIWAWFFDYFLKYLGKWRFCKKCGFTVGKP